MLRLLVLTLAALQVLAPATSTLSGSVRDQTGAVLPGARVELVDASGTIVRAVVTDAQGNYTFDGVSAGAYDVAAQFEGFRRTSVHLRVAAGRSSPGHVLVLPLASVSQEMTVSAADLIAAAAGANRDAVVVTDQDLKDLPIFDRDVVGTLSRMLDPAAMGTGGVTLVVDGMEAQRVGVSPSAIQQVKLNQDPYSAEYPRPGRGRIEIITKAGADAYEGSFDFTFRDASLNARDPFAPTPPPEQRRIYEGTAGGPVAGGKHSSFLFTIERREEDLQSIVFAAGPSGTINAIVARPDRSTQVSASINHQQGRNNTLFVRFTTEVTNSVNQGVGGTTLPEAGSNDHGDEEQVIVGARSVTGSHMLNEFRLLVGREIAATASVNVLPKIVVLDAFTGGGAQADGNTSEYHFQLTDSLTRVSGRHILRAGFAIPDFSRRGYNDRTNTAGTFTFSSLDEYALGRPFSFLQQRGDGNLVFLQKVFGAYVQDQITFGERLSVTPGLRYDWQNVFADNNNFAPRVSAAYALNKKTAIRGGAGIFYDRAGDSAVHDVLRSRENKLQRYIILDPSYPDPFAGTSAASEPRSGRLQYPEPRQLRQLRGHAHVAVFRSGRGRPAAAAYTVVRGVPFLRGESDEDQVRDGGRHGVHVVRVAGACRAAGGVEAIGAQESRRAGGGRSVEAARAGPRHDRGGNEERDAEARRQGNGEGQSPV
jgi:outer membrane receptor protein involved in Fe transport